MKRKKREFLAFQEIKSSSLLDERTHMRVTLEQTIDRSDFRILDYWTWAAD